MYSINYPVETLSNPAICINVESKRFAWFMEYLSLGKKKSFFNMKAQLFVA